jgi:hypothetical protein
MGHKGRESEGGERAWSRVGREQAALCTVGEMTVFAPD